MQAALPDISSEMLIMYDALRPQWMQAVWPLARNLFLLLAIIDFAVAGGFMLLERHSLEEWTAALLRKVMVIGAFYALLINGVDWMQAIIMSFQQIGQMGAGVPSLSPGDIFMRGLNIAGAMMATANSSAYLTNIGGALAVVVASLLTAISFFLISTAYMVLLVESFAVLTAGLIFLGFGGSRWTQPYVERYIALGVAIGLKIMLFYFLVGTGMSLSDQWLIYAASLNSSAVPAMSAFGVMGASMMFLVLCWQIPKVFASMLSGAPSLTSGDAIGSSVAVGGAIGAATYMAGKAAVGGGKAAYAAVSGSGGQSAGGSGRASAASASVVGTTSTPTAVPPPSASGTSQSGVGGSGNTRSTTRGFTAGRAVPNDQAPAPPPPRMPIDGKDD